MEGKKVQTNDTCVRSTFLMVLMEFETFIMAHREKTQIYTITSPSRAPSRAPANHPVKAQVKNMFNIWTETILEA